MAEEVIGMAGHVAHRADGNKKGRLMILVSKVTCQKLFFCPDDAKSGSKPQGTIIQNSALTASSGDVPSSGNTNSAVLV